MVTEMKAGFMAALEQLGGVQDGEAHQDGQASQGRLSDVLQSVDTLKGEVGRLAGSVRDVASTQQSLQEQLARLQDGQAALVQELVNAGILSNKARDVVSKAGGATGGDRQPAQAVQDGADAALPKDQGEDVKAVTAAACKSLSLTQALAARCQDIDVSDSSEEELQQHHERQICGKSQGTDSPARRAAVQEMVDMEQEYCRQLWTMVNVYQLPLQDGNYMSSRQLSTLFPGPLGELCEHHCQMLHSLQDRLVHWSYAGVVGDVFARMADSNSNLLGLYQEYVESLPGSISCLRRQLAQSRTFRSFVKGQRESNPGPDLLTLLISPLQRVPKYMLQLQQVLRHTSEAHPDHFNLAGALQRLQDFVERLNRDITHTTQAIALDLQHLQAQGASFRSSASGSSCEVMPASTSTIDSGIHSTGEDTFPPRFIRNGRNDHEAYLPKWLERQAGGGYPGPHGATSPSRRAHPGSNPRLAAHSQPDLSYGAGGYVMPSALDPQASVPQIRLQPKDGSSARQRRYKIKRRVDGGGSSGGSVPRPSSAIDFNEQREQVMMRPHSVMGPFPGDGRRVIQVYGRGKPPRSGQRMGGQGGADPLSQTAPLPHSAPNHAYHHAHHAHHAANSHHHHHHQTATSPRQMVNGGHWEGGARGGHGGEEYDEDEDDEDDTRDPSVRSGSVSKGSGRSRQGETETDGSDDYNQEDLAAALSQHLNASGHSLGGHPAHGQHGQHGFVIDAKDLWAAGGGGGGHHHHPQHHQHHNHNHRHPGVYEPNGGGFEGEDGAGFEDDEDDEEEEEEEDEHIDVQMDSPESGSYPCNQLQPQKPPEGLVDELKLDLTCFDDENEGKVKATVAKLQKRALPADPRPRAQSLGGILGGGVNSGGVNPLSMKPQDGGSGGPGGVDTSEGPTQALDRSQKDPPKEVVDTLSGVEKDKLTSLPPILPNVHDQNSRVLHHPDLDRPRQRSATSTPVELGTAVARPAVMRRAATPSDFHMADAKARGRKAQPKNASTENLHRSIDDVSLSASKKKPFRTSLKNLFNRKKHTESDV